MSSMRTRLGALVVGVAVVIALLTGVASGANPFTDIGGSPHADNIDAIYEAGITAGCRQGPTFYCPNDPVTRAQMASFIARIAGLSSGTTKNMPKVNARGQTQSYCAVAAANPHSFKPAPCGRVSNLVAASAASTASVAIGSDGLPLIAYYDDAADDLRVARCNDALCATNTTVPIDTAGDVGPYVSLAVTADGFPVMSYYDATNTNLKFAFCFDAKCAFPQVVTVDNNAADVGKFTALAIGADGTPVISYFNDTDNVYRVAKCSDLSCTTSIRTTLNSIRLGGGVSSIAVGSDGFPIVSYHGLTLGESDLEVAHCTNASCSTHTVATLDGAESVGAESAITVGIDGLPVIAYRDDTNASLKVAHCKNVACTSADFSPISAGSGYGISIAIGTDGSPLIGDNSTFFIVSTVLYSPQLIDCTDLLCTTTTERPLLTQTDSLNPTSVAIGTDGLPLVSIRSQNAVYSARPAVN